MRILYLVILMLLGVHGTQAFAIESAEHATADPRTDAFHVAVTSPILHSWVQAIMQGRDGAAPVLLPQQAGASAHDASLRPADIEAARQMDVIFWFGAETESGMARYLHALHNRTEVTTYSLAEQGADALALLSIRQNGHRHTDAAGDVMDGHFWLDPVRVAKAIGKIAEALGAYDADYAALYQTNATAYQHKLAALHQAYQQALAPYEGQTYLAYHDAWQYLDDRYGVQMHHALAVHHDRPLQPDSMQQAVRAIASGEVACFLAEATSSNNTLSAAKNVQAAVISLQHASATPFRTATLDVAGNTITPAHDAYEPGAGYIAMMRRNLTALTGCLEE